MTKVLLWPDIYREQGHWLPAVSLAKSLVDDPHPFEVEFMGILDCEAIVAPYKATFRPIFEDIYPLGHSVENKLEPVGQRWKPHHLLPLCRGELDPIFTGPDAPELLVYGYFTSLEALIIHYKYEVPLIGLTTYLRHPSEDPASFALSKLVHMPEAVVEKIINLATANSGFTMEQFVAPLEDGPEMIPCVREFDFFDDDWEHSPNVNYVEPMIVREPLDGSALPNNPPPPEDGRSDVYHEIPSGTDAKIIFGTSGSQVDDYEDKARGFFHSLIAMMKTQGLQDHHLVLSVGEKLLQDFRIFYGIDKNAFQNALPSNVTLAAWVSQQDILRDAKVVFMHGGLATIKEAIWENVPIVIIPHGKDQDENALRIRRAGIGIYPDVEGTNPRVLRSLMTEVTTSTWVKKRLAEMQAVFSAAESASPKPSISMIKAHLGI